MVHNVFTQDDKSNLSNDDEIFCILYSLKKWAPMKVAIKNLGLLFLQIFFRNRIFDFFKLFIIFNLLIM